MRILIVDDDKLVCSSLKTILEAQGQTIAGIGCSGREALQLYRETNPDVLLMDIRMEGMNGVDASEAILHSFPDARILFLTTFSDDDYIIRTLKLGVKGYILKQNFDSIIPALEAVYMGQNVFNTEIIAKLPDLLKQHTKETLCSYDLNERELHFIQLVAKGPVSYTHLSYPDKYTMCSIRMQSCFPFVEGFASRMKSSIPVIRLYK